MDRQDESGFEADSEFDCAYPAFMVYAPLSITSVLEGSGCACGVEGFAARAGLDVPMIRVKELDCSKKDPNIQVGRLELFGLFCWTD